MGEARRKQESHRALLERYPVCIYCAGPADTIEHMPPTMLFKGKRRPNQFVFPACEECNTGTGDADLVASLFARAYPDEKDEEGRSEVRKLFAAAGNNVPGLLQEMRIGRGGQKLARKGAPGFIPPDAKFLRADGPILKRHTRTFAAKLGFALHFKRTGTALPLNGGVCPIIFTNLQALRDEIPESFIRMLPPPETLQQGKQHVRDQFEYSFRLADDHSMGGYLAKFRFGFFAAGFVAADALDLAEQADDWPIVRPGAFRRCR